MSNVLQIHKPIRAVSVEYKVPFPLIDHIIVEEERGCEIQQEHEDIPAPETIVENIQTESVLPEEPVQQPMEDTFKIARLLEEARAEGYNDGYNQAKKELESVFQKKLDEIVAQQVQPAIQNLMLVTGAVQKEWKKIGQRIEESVLSLAMSIAQQIVKTELTSNSMIVVQQTREALQKLAGVEKLKIRIHPEDEKIIKQYRPDLLASTDSVREIVFETDEHITRGGCIIESDSGNIDATIETQFDRIKNVLFADHEVLTP